jgi:hypothetical protein
MIYVTHATPDRHPTFNSVLLLLDSAKLETVASAIGSKVIVSVAFMEKIKKD